MANTLGAYDLELGDAVGATVLHEALECGVIIGGKTQDHGAGAVKEEAQLAGPLRVEFAATCVYLCLYRSWCGVISSMNKSAIGF